MTSADADWLSRSILLDLATAAGQQRLRFWQQAIAALDAGAISVDDLRGMIWTAEGAKSERRPSRATAYRYVTAWRPIVTDLANPGRGA